MKLNSAIWDFLYMISAAIIFIDIIQATSETQKFTNRKYDNFLE